MFDGAGRSINTLLTKENTGFSFLNDFIIFSLEGAGPSQVKALMANKVEAIGLEPTKNQTLNQMCLPFHHTPSPLQTRLELALFWLTVKYFTTKLL